MFSVGGACCIYINVTNTSTVQVCECVYHHRTIFIQIFFPKDKSAFTLRPDVLSLQTHVTNTLRETQQFNGRVSERERVEIW